MRTYVRSVPDFPHPGVIFRDITPLLQNGEAFHEAVIQLAAYGKERGATLVVGPEARGFVIGAPIAFALQVGFVPVRKSGKLPAETIRVTYALEYGQDVLEMHRDAVSPGDRVLLADDLLATGGTAEATMELVQQAGGEVIGACFLIELRELNGRQRLKGLPIQTLLSY